MIAYRVKGVYSGLSSCYGSINSILNRGLNNGIPFDGIRLFFSQEALHADIKKTGYPVYSNYATGAKLFKEAKPLEDIYDTLAIARSVGFSDYLPKNDTDIVQKGYIDFHPSVPFIVVVALTGFFRWYDNHKYFMDVYRLLHKQMMKDYDKFLANWRKTTPREYQRIYGAPQSPRAVSLFLLANALSFGDKQPLPRFRRPKTHSTDPEEPRRSWSNLVVHTHSTHSVVPSNAFTLDGLALFSSWRSRVDTLISMKDEYEKEKSLSYQGRDTFFAGCGPLYSHLMGNLTKVDPRLNVMQNIAYSFLPKKVQDDAMLIQHTKSNPIVRSRLLNVMQHLQYGVEGVPCLSR